MGSLKPFFVDNWKSKLVSLLIALSIWHLIKSHLDSGNQGFPVPGTTTVPRPASGTVLDGTPLNPFTPPPPIAPPVPGGQVKGL